ncbi:MAG: tRNA (adenosine(37)-N6)-threonylcarbamoyltransferase complex dimerization subunit type 1 TsaB, partial [bacterium]|nr:tRNA (adenosine(37)-N6)-threonylcarbamoyltransferase complex dimerization subunit type 1 TsaB [bacterium]
MILSIDTSTALTSVCVTDADDVVVELSHLDARKHAEVLAPMLSTVLGHVDRSDVDAVAVGVGPGPYTGMRVGIATATAFAAAWGLPVFGLCSLDAIAESRCATDVSGPFGVASDARRQEIYWARYDEQGSRTDGPRVGRRADIDAHLLAGAWIGDLGVDQPAGEAPVHPQASWVGRRVARLLRDGAQVATADAVLSIHGVDGGSTSDALR